MPRSDPVTFRPTESDAGLLSALSAYLHTCVDESLVFKVTMTNCMRFSLRVAYLTIQQIGDRSATPLWLKQLVQAAFADVFHGEDE